MKILIVDDNSDDRAMLSRILKVHGHDTMEAVNGREGIQAASGRKLDLIISDVFMPVMDGFQFLRKLRKTSSVPFVFYSAVYDGAKDMQLATSLGADGYLIKPKDPLELLEEIERIAGKGHLKIYGSVEEDAGYLKRYSQVVVSKLEEKVRELEETVAERSRAMEALRANQQKLTEMAVQLSMAEERERRRIATELHDNIGQTLLLGKMKLRSLAGALSTSIDRNALEEILRLQDQVIRSVRSLTQQLSPPVLSGAGLEAALEWLGRRMEEDYGLRVVFTDDRQPKPLSEDMRAILFQAARELLINAAKHAETEAARIEVGRDGDMLYLAVEDRGVGFDPAETGPGDSCDSGFGLFNIRERLKQLGGEVTIDSAPGKGTRVTLRAPVMVKGTMKDEG